MTGTRTFSDRYVSAKDYLLSNGWTVTVEEGHYGDIVTRLAGPDGEFWHCSDGRPDLLPEFAKDWVERVRIYNLVRPRFEVIHDNKH